MQWPNTRLLVQVLDDSTCEETRRLVEDKVLEWRERGVNIENRWRSNRKGYKAGALMEAEKYIENYEYTAIFDADFRPDADFLLQTIPYLKENPKVLCRHVFTCLCGTPFKLLAPGASLIALDMSHLLL